MWRSISGTILIITIFVLFANTSLAQALSLAAICAVWVWYERGDPQVAHSTIE